VIKLSSLSKPMQEVLKRFLAPSASLANLPMDLPGLSVVPQVKFTHSFDNSYSQAEYPIPGTGDRAVLDKFPGNTPISNAPVKVKDSFPEENGLTLLASERMDRSVFESALVDVPRLYQAWLKSRYKLAEGVLDEFLRKKLSTIPMLKDLKRSNSTDFDALPQDLKKYMEDTFRSTWKRHGKSEADIDKEWAKARYLGIRCDFCLTFKSPGPNGGNLSTFGLGVVGIGP
jgi:hypothetical protein